MFASGKASVKNDNPVQARKKRFFVMSFSLVVLLLAAGLFFVLFSLEAEPVVDLTGAAEAVAVTPASSFDGLTHSSGIFDELYYPVGVAVMGSSIVVADSMNDRIQILNESGNEFVGIHGRFGLSYADSGAFIDGFRENAMFMKPSGVFVTPSGDFIVADTNNHAIRLVIGEFVVTIAGNGTPGFQDGHETDALFNHPHAAVMCQDGYIYVADTLNHVIRRISPEGLVSLFAGAPGQPGFADGSLSQSMFFEPSGLYLTDNGVLYIADAANHAIRRIENGIVSTVAGAPGEHVSLSVYTEGGHVDGPNAIARFNFPRDIALLDNGYIFVADSLNHAVRLITPTSTRTIVGGDAGFFHDSVENMQLTRPSGIATDGQSLFVSDTVNNRIVSIPLTQRVLAGRPSRGQMLDDSGITISPRFVFRGDIRVFLGDERLDMGRVQPWVRGESVFIPIRPFLEALGAVVYLNENSDVVSVFVDDTVTFLQPDQDYFVMRGVMVTTLAELTRLFPYTIEWFPELSLITLFVPYDLQEG